MVPVIAIVGRPNVGKSTLFNCLTRSRDAIVADYPGLTRDRQYGEGSHHQQNFIVVDTGGIGEESDSIHQLMAGQAFQAMQEADVILFMVDGRSGVTGPDEVIARDLRQLEKTIYLVVNKVDGLDAEIAKSDFYSLGFQDIIAIAASHRRGVTKLLDQILEPQPQQAAAEETATEETIKVALVGKPNVGKSTLTNRLLGEERVVVFDAPGTTRSSIYIPFQRQEQHYTLIDTAGVRRRSKVDNAVEKFSVIKTLQAIEEAHVVILVIDARGGITEQDLRLLGFVLDAGRSLIITVNKWDNMPPEDRRRVKDELDRRLGFIDFAKIHFISALHGTGVGDLYRFINAAYHSAMKSMQTSQLTTILTDLIQVHQPPTIKGRRIKLRYAHPGGNNPPTIVIHGKQTKDLPNAYIRYLAKGFRKALKLTGTPIRIQLKTDENPYEGKRNKLTPRQQRKQKRDSR
jgi:GTP-binding protein